MQGPQTVEPRRCLPPGGLSQEEEHGGSGHEDPEDGEDPMVQRDRRRRRSRTGAFGLNWGVFSQTVMGLF
jgi:hypothetical protein